MADQPATSSPVKVSWLIGTMAALVLFAFIAGYSQQMTYLYKDYSQQRAADRVKILEKVQDDENKELNTLDWIDQGKKTIRIPVERAMEVEIQTLLLQPAAVCAEIPGAAPAPAATNAAPVNAAAPATNAAPVKPAAPGAKAAPAPAAAASTNAAPVKPKAPAQPKQ